MAKDPIELFKKLEADPFPPLKGRSVYAIFIRASIYVGAWHLMYIGSSKDVEKRRNRSKHPFRYLSNLFPDAIVCMKCFLTEDYIEDERILINYFKPVLNIQIWQKGLH